MNAANKTLLLNGNSSGTVNFTADGTLQMGANRTLTGSITTGTTSTGSLKFLGASTVTGDIGVNAGNVLKLVDIGSTSTVAFAGNVDTTTLNFSYDGIATI